LQFYRFLLATPNAVETLTKHLEISGVVDVISRLVQPQDVPDELSTGKVRFFSGGGGK
jgi:hypothetical protein